MKVCIPLVKARRLVLTYPLHCATVGDCTTAEENIVYSTLS